MELPFPEYAATNQAVVGYDPAAKGPPAKSVFRRVRGGWHGLKKVDSIRQSKSIRHDQHLTRCPIRRFRIPE